LNKERKAHRNSWTWSDPCDRCPVCFVPSFQGASVAERVIDVGSPLSVREPGRHGDER